MISPVFICEREVPFEPSPFEGEGCREVVPGTRQAIPNPANPNIAASIAKGLRG